MGDHLSAEEQTQAAIDFVAALKIGQPVLLAAVLCLAGYRAAMLSGEDSLERREEIVSQFRARKINYLCVVDIYNEGVDIPEIDTVLFGCYTREEQLAIFGRRTAEKASAIPQSGCLNLDDINTELLWVTLNKSDKDFSPSTQYEDYAINEALFNWQSQNSASHQNSGRRYVEQRTNGRKFLLFVKEHKVDAYGFTSPYYCLGLVDYVKSHGDRPMTITWAMQNRIPGFILDKAQKMAVG